MNKSRLEAFSDGVFAIIITIMVLELHVPKGITWDALTPLFTSLVSYVLSFVFIGIYWGNHHHLIHIVQRVNGKMMWANLHLLFWLSLVPFATKWMGENDFEPVAVSAYGALLVLCGVAFTILAKLVFTYHAKDPKVIAAFRQSDRKAKLSTVLYLSSVPLAFVHPAISLVIFAVVGVMWVIPSKDFEKLLEEL